MSKGRVKVEGPQDLSPQETALYTDWSDDAATVVGGFESELWDETEPIVGFLIGTRLNVGPHKSSMYELETPNGPFSVWGSTVLNNKLEDVPTGALVRIEMLGEHQGAEYTYKDYSVKFKNVPSQSREVAFAAGAAVGPF